MEGSFMSNKRPFDHSATAVDRQELNGGGMKRPFFKPPPPPLKLSAGETLFRILCPAIKTGGVIGKGGAIIRQFREETGAKIRIDDSVPGCDERVILIVAETLKRKKENNNGDLNAGGDNNNTEEEDLGGNLMNSVEDDDVSPAQKALIRVFERILKVDEERVVVVGGVSGGESSEDLGGEEEKEKTTTTTTTTTTPTTTTTQNMNSVVCRLLAPSNQVGCVLGRGGKIVEKIRQGSGAQVRVLPKDHIPACAFPGDELIQQITGNFSAVRKALLSVSSCLQENSRTDATNSAATKPSGSVLWGSGMPGQVDQFPSRGYPSGSHALDYHSRGYSSIPGSESIGASHRKIPEEEVVYRLLCHLDKVGSLIGKGGSIIRALQNDTGASIKIADAAPDSDERVVLISAREAHQRHSPAQDAVIRVHSRIAEVGLEPDAAVVARLLVPSHQIGCLLGKGGNIIAEMRRATGASIRIFAKEQVPKCGAQNDEVVQVIGSLQSVQDALFHITSRVRETILPMKAPFPSISAPPYLSGAMEGPIPLFRPRHEPASPGHYPSSVGFSNRLDHSVGPPHHMDRHPVPVHGMDHPGVIMDRVPYPYGSERPAHGPTFDRPSSPRSWAPQSVSNGNPRCAADAGTGFASRNGLVRSGSQVAVVANRTVEVVVPLVLLGYIIGENNGDLNQIRQISGAKVVVHDARPGNTDGVVLVSGTTDQIHAAQSLIHAFILSGQTTT
ncbi:K Homology domain [Macleaya cordata]|uniref:K Homology domain n=1 Tax=Macleaya cordata TaxID=56857 RepID=A0A200QZC3_MACCD|nr:K Homology domain [Macleaya cordata]